MTMRRMHRAFDETQCQAATAAAHVATAAAHVVVATAHASTVVATAATHVPAATAIASCKDIQHMPLQA